MDNGKIIAAIDEQIGKLQQAKQLLGGASSTLSTSSSGRQAGRKATTGKRTLSASARKRISLAQKARWASYKAKQKKAA